MRFYSQLLLLVACLFLASCGKSNYVNTEETRIADVLPAAEKLDKFANRIQSSYGINRVIVIAGPDQYNSGSAWIHPVTVIDGDDVGFNIWAEPYSFHKDRSEAVKLAEQKAIEGCEKQIGPNLCFVYFVNGLNVRMAKRQIWLKKNPKISSDYQKKRAEYQKLASRSSSSSNGYSRSVAAAPVSNQKSNVDYDQAAALFRISQEALNSTLPKVAPMPKICTNTWTGTGWQSICH